MDEHTTWLDLLPGYHNLEEYFRQYFGRNWSNTIFPPQEHFSMTHVFLAFFVGLCLMAVAFSYRRHARSEAALMPAERLTFFSFVELLLSALLRFLTEIVGSEKDARRFFPMGAGIFVFVMFSDLIGLLPGFEPPTAHLQMNLAIALTVFVATHYFGIRQQGWRYLKQFTGDSWLMAPLMLVLEVVSHIVRPLSLTVRLLGNMFADHKVLAIFTLLFPLVIPIPFLFLGLLVSLIQALVFMTLSVIYFSLATSQEH
ncbi:MAG: ATP synthase F0 subunit A [Deltaproteobacteria bacterium HGW-Deltaproteobacteria-22]|jgi:F-type H+-transporting ATPase subunit a|nr:MAG: ATP synthase F0 subunit A [Deltaproteobacteria bacterium HGW-Deltaproteobacteria-22]